MRKSQQKPVSEKRWTFDENEKPEKRLGDIREKFEHMIVDGPPVKNVTGFKSDVHHSGEDHNINHKIQVDNHGKIFEIHEKSAPGFESQVLNVRVDQNRNSQNQGTGYKSRVLHSGVDQNRNVPNQDILGKKFAPQESSEKAPVKSDKGEQDIDKLQIKIDDLQKKIGDLLKKIDKGENDKYNLLKQIGDLVRKLDKAEQDRDDLLRILEKTPKKDEEISATIGDLLKKLDKGEQDRDVLREKIEKMKQEKDEIAQEKNEIAQEKEVLKHNLEKMKQEKDEIAQEKGDLVRKLDKAEQDRDDLLRILEKTPKKDEEISATIGDLLKKLDKAEKDRDVLREKIDEIAQEKEFPPRVNGIDTFPAIYLLCLLVMFLIIGVFWREYHRNDDLLRILEKTPKKDEEISATIGDLLKKLGDFLKKLDVLQEKIDEIAQEKEQLKKEIERKRAQFKSAWRDIPLYGDWRKEEFQAVNLTLDAATAHPALFLSEEGRRITWQEPCQDLPSSPERFVSLPCVLGQLHVSSERYFWEVEVQDAHSWDLGVCMNNVARTGRITVSPQNGFWAIRLYSGEYWGLTSPETSLTLKEKPCKVGVFLDYEAGDVSFYNMTDGSHIYTFSKQTFHGVLRPLFRLWSSDSGPLTIVQVE